MALTTRKAKAFLDKDEGGVVTQAYLQTLLEI
jgi:hypothetical protein